MDLQRDGAAHSIENASDVLGVGEHRNTAAVHIPQDIETVEMLGGIVSADLLDDDPVEVEEIQAVVSNLTPLEIERRPRQVDDGAKTRAPFERVSEPL
jgi:hypothetical protein